MLIATGGGGLKNKAFTLIELLAVIIILGVIALIVYPIIMGTIERSKKASFARSIDGLMESAKVDYSDDSFIAPREYFYEKRDLTLLTVQEETRDEDVKIIGRIDGNGFIYIDEEGNISVDICTDDYYAKGPEDDVVITDNPDGTCQTIGKEDPVISLIGDSIIYLNLGEEYKEFGAKARTKVGGKLEYTTEIKKNNEVVGSIDTSREGTYEVVYSTSNNEKTVSVTRTVVILDMTPIITMTEPNMNYVKSQDILINVTATKPNHITEFTYEVLKDGVSMKKETVSGLSKNLSFSETGIYEVIVSVTDNNDHSNRVSKTYKIDHTGPVITFDPETVELESEDVDGYDLLTGVTVTDNVDGTIENSKVRTSGTLAKAPGNYTITYSVSDRLGNESTRERTFVVKDLTKPEITFAPNEQSTFVKSKTITITATDNIKVNSISYVLIKDNVRGNVTTIANGGTVTVNSTGNYKLEVTAVDSSNNTSTKTSGVYKIDTTVPSIAFSNVQLKITEVSGYDLMTGVTTSDNSGVISRVDKSGALSATLGTQTITYTVYDQAGNSTSKTRTFTIVEADGPILALSNEGSNSWTKAQTITATATDNSNLKTFTYEVFKNNVSQGVKNGTINGKSGSVSIPLNQDGTYTIKLTASDQYNNGNTKTSSSVYKIDVTAPTAPTTMNFVYGNWSAYPNNTWTNQDVYVARSQASPGPTGSTDGTSGVAKYQMSLDNKNWFDYAYTASGNYLLSSDGEHKRYFRAVDHAGNASSSILRIAKIDKTPPTPGTATFSGTQGSNGWYTSNVTVNVQNGSDTGSGHKSTTTNISSITSNTTGTTVRITTTDNAGNSNYRDYTIKVDKTVPSISATSGTTAISPGTNSAIPGSYFTITSANDYSGTSISCIDTSNSNTAVSNTSTLTSGTHNIKCTVTRGNGKTANATKTIAIAKTVPEIMENPGSNGSIRTDNSGNKRYAGSNPNNYVCFGKSGTTCASNHLYRIIGLFDGKMKIIKNSFYSTSSKWDSNGSAYGIGSNEWGKPADLKTELNGSSFYNNTSYIDSTHKTYIVNVYWGIGAVSSDSVSVSTFEDSEKNSSASGYVGLMSMTDFAYASNKSGCGRGTWLATPNNACFSNNWLYTTSYAQWTIIAYQNNTRSVHLINTSGYINGQTSNGTAAVKPAMYLDSSVKILSGTGTSTDPYILTK